MAGSPPPRRPGQRELAQSHCARETLSSRWGRGAGVFSALAGAPLLEDGILAGLPTCVGGQGVAGAGLADCPRIRAAAAPPRVHSLLRKGWWPPGHCPGGRAVTGENEMSVARAGARAVGRLAIAKGGLPPGCTVLPSGRYSRRDVHACSRPTERAAATLVGASSPTMAVGGRWSTSGMVDQSGAPCGGRSATRSRRGVGS